METERSKTVLVTGGAGFIGTAIAERMSARFGRWVAFDILHPQVHPSGDRPASLPAAVELVVGDVTSTEDWDSLFATTTPDIVIHLAAETGTSQSLSEASRHALVNVVGTTQLTDALTRHGVRPELIVLASSRAVYGEGSWQAADGTLTSPGQRSHEQLLAGQWDFANSVPAPSEAGVTTPHPVNVYGATKLAQENVLEAWCGSNGIRRTVLRLQNVYGPGQSLINPYTGIVSLFSQRAEDQRVIPVYEDGRIVRDFVYIDDVAAAFDRAIALGDREGPFDIGSGTATTILEMARSIAGYYGAPEPEVTGAFRDGDVRHAECTIANTSKELGWAPEWNLERGLSALQAWLRTQEQRVST